LLVSVGKDRNVRVWAEDVDEKLLRRRRERIADQEEQAARAEQEMAAGYEVEDDEDEHAHMDGLEGAPNGAMAIDGVEHESNGHALEMEVDGAAA
jgi:hypothetical protein